MVHKLQSLAAARKGMFGIVFEKRGILAEEPQMSMYFAEHQRTTTACASQTVSMPHLEARAAQNTQIMLGT